MLRSAAEHYRRQQRITALALRSSKRSRNLSDLVRTVTAFQLAAARDAADSVPLMLAEQGIPNSPVAAVAVTSLAGVASDGRPLETLFPLAVNSLALDLMVVTQIQDAARASAGIGVAIRTNVTGYTRMLNPPSCSRCAVLAGKFYKWNAGFQRHPRCDCRHIPTSEDRAGDLTTNPDAYFRSLSPAEQEKHFTKAGAQAIRDGADISQVVNARRGMNTAGLTETTTKVINGERFVVNVHRRTLAPVDIGGRPTFVSSEGTTKRGTASRARTGRNMKVRLMPESIYEVARDRDDALRLLKLHGFIF